METRKQKNELSSKSINKKDDDDDGSNSNDLNIENGHYHLLLSILNRY